MPEAIPVVAEFLGASGVAAGSAAATEAAITGEAVFAGYGAAAAGSAMATEAAITAGAAGAAGGAAASAGTGSVVGDLLGKAGTSLATGIGTAVASSLLAPKPPSVPTPTVAPVLPMPDPLAQQDAMRKSIIEQTARRGRASTIMTSPSDSSGGKLGG